MFAVTVLSYSYVTDLETVTKYIHSFRDQSVIGNVTFSLSTLYGSFAAAPTLSIQRPDQSSFTGGLPPSLSRTVLEPTALHNSSPTVQGDPERPESFPPGWEERIDPISQRPYYINHNTKTSSWIAPPSGPS
jgi:hypothetical protein